MKLRCAVLCAVSFGALVAADAGLTHIRTVYVLPMSGGLDQYLANQLTASGRYQVVTDPAHADAVFTDRLGTEFEGRLKELYPPPPPPPVTSKPAGADQDQKEEDKSLASLLGEAGGGGVRMSTFSRGRGNVFLVDRHGQRVLWSTYLRPRSTRPDVLNHVAKGIVDRLDDAAGKEVKRMQRDEKRAGQAVPAAVAPAASAPATPAAPKPNDTASPPAPAANPAAPPAPPVGSSPTVPPEGK